MAKKPPPKGKLLKLKPKGKVIQLKPKGKVLQLKKKQPATARKSPPLQPMPPPRALDAESEQRLQEAMEELAEARNELSRLGHAMTAAHREIEDHRLSSTSARDH